MLMRKWLCLLLAALLLMSAPATLAREDASAAQQQETSADDAQDDTGAGDDDEGGDEPEPANGLTITLKGATTAEDGTLTYTPARSAKLAFIWTKVKGAKRYAYELTGPDGAQVKSGTGKKAKASIKADKLTAGAYAFTVQALDGEGAVLESATLAFTVANGQGGDRPPRMPHFPRRTGSGGENPGFTVTPGTALSSSHADGTGDMTMYGTVSLKTARSAQDALTLGGEALDVTLEGGALFEAEAKDGVLTLTAEEAGASWLLNMLALKTLARSGVEEIRLVSADGARTLPTEWTLSGAPYAALRAAGYVSKDMTLVADAEGLRVEAAGETYELNDEGELCAG